ncbi:hypothetical protein DFP72DRAFT_986801 [Ephemerocybe angulata]|uniref:DNA2/NAM7 helicase helicase domain-containing protein n=1 Tax=Ephemerocybe angulata TaxID=980116 RepID=A0A8H6IEW6_9AGAR|nr:hypothetical protein DFP72DRAFT_986801 [Tulosesus angulatus]
METRNSSLSATNLAVYHHLNCDLYLHNVYHKHTQPTTPDNVAQPEAQLLVDSQYQRGINWEATLYSWLDESNLLLKVPPMPLEAAVLYENILADDRSHFFIAGVTFDPPRASLRDRFEQAGTVPINFGVGKPDLIEITRDHQGITWKVIDAKASKSIKTSHHAQIYFYTLCLEYLLQYPAFKPSGEGGIWLPPDEGFNVVPPSISDIKSIEIPLLSRSLDSFLFERLPRLLSLPRDSVRWHFNPLCQGCKYNPECRSLAIESGRLGSMPNISISDAKTLQELLDLTEQGFPDFTRSSSDIEDLHQVVTNSEALSLLDQHFPIVAKKGKRIIGVRRKTLSDRQSAVTSSVLESARKWRDKGPSKALTKAPQPVISRRNFTCPTNEDIEFFTVSLFDSLASEGQAYSGKGSRFIIVLATIIRELTSGDDAPTAQFYVWSPAEQALLQTHLIRQALVGEVDREDIRLCIGALSQGASLLQTAFQPVLLSGALLAFLAKGKRLKAEYQACLARMELSTDGTVPELRARVEQALERLQGIGPQASRDSHEFGQLPRIVIVKKEIESMIALPIAGYWDLQECAGNEKIFKAFKKDSDGVLEEILSLRNSTIYATLNAARRVVKHHGQNLLEFMDVCRQDHLRKLFFMQQFEVLSKLNELWTTRMEGSPDAPVLQYRGSTSGLRGIEHTFTIVSGVVDVPASDKDISFFDKLLVEDLNSDTEIPLEAMFDDLAVSGLVIPLNRWTKPSWELQHPRVKENVLLADLRNVQSLNGKLVVSLRSWGTATRQVLVPGRHYRLSPRFIDFNTTKVLSSLFEMDLRWENKEDQEFGESGGEGIHDHRGVPFLQLVMEPRSFGRVPKAKESLTIEENTQRVFRSLKKLDVGPAGSLLLKPSQHRATQRLLANRLAVIWGPPGTGKTHTIALSILRLLEAQWKLDDRGQKIIFLTAMTHAAIDACQSKLERLIDCYRSIDFLELDWLDNIRIERVMRGNDHPPPARGSEATHIYAGTLYQVRYHSTYPFHRLTFSY